MNYETVAYRLDVEVDPNEPKYLDINHPEIYTPLPYRLWKIIHKLLLDKTIIGVDLTKTKEGERKGWVIGGIYFLPA